MLIRNITIPTPLRMLSSPKMSPRMAITIASVLAHFISWRSPNATSRSITPIRAMIAAQIKKIPPRNGMNEKAETKAASANVIIANTRNNMASNVTPNGRGGLIGAIGGGA